MMTLAQDLPSGISTNMWDIVRTMFGIAQVVVFFGLFYIAWIKVLGPERAAMLARMQAVDESRAKELATVQELASTVSKTAESVRAATDNAKATSALLESAMKQAAEIQSQTARFHERLFDVMQLRAGS